MLALATLAVAALVAAHLLPGLVGVLSRWSAAGTALALAALATRVPPSRGRPPRREPPTPRTADATVSWVIGGGAAGAVALWLLASAWNRTVLPTEDVDSLTIHFPIVGAWIRSGSLWDVHQFTPLLAHGNYPHTGDLVFLAAILPWKNEWLAGAINPAFIALAGVAVHALARELGAARPQAMLGGALFASLPAVAGAANGEALTDSIGLAALGAGLLFLLRHERGATRDELWLAAVALGLAFGTKWYLVPAVAIVVAVWAGSRAVRRAEPRATLRDGALLAGTVAAVGGVWLLRNAVESGSPTFPAEIAVLGLTVFDAPFNPVLDCAGFSIFHYATDGGVWGDHLLPAFRHGFVWPGAAIGAGLVGALALAARRGGRDVPRGAIAAAAALAALIALAYALTPTSAAGPEGDPVLAAANTRYAVPALLVAAPLAAWALGRAGRLRVPLELLGAAAVVHGIDKTFLVPMRVVLAVLAALVALAGAGWLVLALTGRLAPRARDRARLAAVGACVVALAAVGHDRQREFNADRYAEGGGAEAWIARNAPSGHRIALAGVWGEDIRSPVWPSYGERLANEVDFLGPTADGQLREHSSRADWAAALRRGRYDLLVVGRGGYPDECAIPGSESDDDRWAREEGLRAVARSERLTVYRVPPGPH